MQINAQATVAPVYTHGGAPAFRHMNKKQELRRSVLSCLLWEDTFYERGESIADRITGLASKVHMDDVSALAVEARNDFHLRHVPLLLIVAMCKQGGNLVSETIQKVIQRPDEMCELLSIYWKDGRKPISKQLKLGLAKAFTKFTAYQLAKYNRDNQIKLRDVLFLVHPKPMSALQAETWEDLVNKRLASPETWEVALSGGADKKESFERLIKDGKLGYLALLRNLRNMMDAGCDKDLVSSAILERKGASKVMPFRYVAAARACPQLEKVIDQSLLACIHNMPKLSGKTIVLVDVSGSMDKRLSDKSDMTRIDAACALASLIDGEVRVFSFSDQTIEIPHRLGMAGVDAISNSQKHNGTYLGRSIQEINSLNHDRLIVITDEQATDVFRCPIPTAQNAYMINVASYKNGIGYGNGWTHLDGFSESVIKYIMESEKENQD